ncbi:MAG: hypothetical protein WCV67_06890 [Victivallaceae bacterium]|jgi:hypothetical protein
MKFLLYLILIAALAIGVHWFIKNVFGNPETEQTASTAAAQTQGQAATGAAATAAGTASGAAVGMPGDVTGTMAAHEIGNSINQNSSPINKTKLMQRVNNINDQHNQSVSKQ